MTTRQVEITTLIISLEIYIIKTNAKCIWVIWNVLSTFIFLHLFQYTVLCILQASNLRNSTEKIVKLKPISVQGPIASIGLRIKTTSLEPFHVADAPTRQ